MELGATMELRDGRGKSTLGKKTPLYSGGTHPTVTPLSSPAQGGTTTWGGTTAVASGTTVPPRGTVAQ